MIFLIKPMFERWRKEGRTVNDDDDDDYDVVQDDRPSVGQRKMNEGLSIIIIIMMTIIRIQ